MNTPIRRQHIGWGALVGGTALVLLAVAVSTPDSAATPDTPTTTRPAAATTTTNPLTQQLAPLDTRSVRYATKPESEPLERILPDANDAAELLNDEAAITVDGPLDATSNIPGWLRGWRTERSEVLLTITTHPQAQDAEMFARQNTSRHAHEYSNGEPSPRNWTMPAAEQLWIDASSDMARIVARYGKDVVIVTAYTPGSQNPPVPIAAALLARTQTRLAPSPAPERRGRIDGVAIQPTWPTAALIPVWINGKLPTRGSLYRIDGDENRCLAYDNTDRYSPGSWIRAGC